MKRWTNIAMASILCGTLGLMTGTVSMAQTKKPAAFSSGSTIRLVISQPPGGGYDTYGRLVAPFLAKELGVRQVVVDNKVGGGGYAAVNWLYLSAPRDGTTLVFANGETLVTYEMVGIAEQAQFKTMKEFSIIGAFESLSRGIMVNAKLPYKSLSDLKGAKGLKAGTTDPMGTYAIQNAIAAECLGLQDFKIISGYGGTPEIALSVARGELDLFVSPWDNVLRQSQTSAVRVLGTLAKVKPAPYKDLPTISEAGIAPGSEKWLDVLYAVAAPCYLFLAPPRVPEERVKVLSDAIQRVLTSPEFKKVFETKAQRPIEYPLNSKQTSEVIDRLVAMPDKDKREYKHLVGEKYYR